MPTPGVGSTGAAGGRPGVAAAGTPPPPERAGGTAATTKAPTPSPCAATTAGGRLKRCTESLAEGSSDGGAKPGGRGVLDRSRLRPASGRTGCSGAATAAGADGHDDGTAGGGAATASGTHGSWEELPAEEAAAKSCAMKRVIGSGVWSPQSTDMGVSSPPKELHGVKPWKKSELPADMMGTQTRNKSTRFGGTILIAEETRAEAFDVKNN